MARFTVDTQLFRQLGELLVGRDSTALIELVKNAYDADAETVTVYGEAIDDVDRGFIQLTDDGVGMTEREFIDGFLRIASRSRVTKTRESKQFGRRFTGEKGLGRLAAHKLARVFEVESVSRRNGRGARKGLRAKIDWDQVEEAETLEGVSDSAIQFESYPVSSSATAGTTITLRGLRRRWTTRELGNFLVEIQDFGVPEALTSSFPKALFQGPLLFDSPKLRDSSSNDPGFDVQLEGAFEAGDEYWASLAESAGWLVEIDARAKGVRYRISPAKQTLLDLPGAENHAVTTDHPAPESGPFFQSRILVQEGGLHGPAKQTAWARRNAGVRVFLEGFRILPYGDRNNDWLSLDYDYARRQRRLPGLKSLALPDLETDKNAPLISLPNRGYFGAVFLLQSKAPTLRTLVNREGFVPEQPFYDLTELVRTGIDLSVRLRAAAGYERRLDRRAKRSMPLATPAEPRVPLARELNDSVDKALSFMSAAKAKSLDANPRGTRKDLRSARSEMETVVALLDDLASEEAMIRVLASVGTQMAAFVHEINALLSAAQSLEAYSQELQGQAALPVKVRHELAEFRSLVGDLRRGLERQAAYLIDIVTPDARRRRRRLKLAERFQAALRLVETSVERQSISVRNNIPVDLQVPPMFPAELTAVLSNLLTNAVKAAKPGGKIRARARRQNGAARLVIENTGSRVDIRKAARWFEPFESTTTDIDPVLGQGMGLGLPITRRVLDEYGARIKFIKPSKGYSTAIEIIFAEE